MRRQLRLISISTLLLAIAPATALAAEAKVLPGTAGTTLAGKSAGVTLQIKGGASISCKSSETTGEITSTTHGSGTTTWKGCTTAGLPVNSVGASSGTIIGPWLYLACIISGLGHDYCYKYFWDTFILLQVPSTKLTLEVKGGFLSEVTPVEKKVTSLTLITTQKEGKQSLETPEGGEATRIEVSTDGGSFVQAGIELKESTLSLGASEEIMM